MTDTAHDYLLNHIGHKKKAAGLIDDNMIRSRLLKLVGEEEAARA
jgi:hypothetical protein